MKYRTIIVDPPWPYEGRMSGALRPGSITAPPMKVAAMPYGTMSVVEIAALPVAQAAEFDAHVYLWATQRYLRDAYDVLDAWGFRHGATLVWSKPPKGVVGTYVCSAEFCLFGRRGSLAHKTRHIGTCFEWPRSGHSAKPEAFIDLVERVSPGPYLELFARRARFGWDYWGDESLGTAELRRA
jgi:N6-adenosine-specific RNA methylase IME4